MKETGSAPFVKGLIAGTIVGVGVSMAVNPPERENVKKLEQTAGRAFSTIGTMLDNFVTFKK